MDTSDLNVRLNGIYPQDKEGNLMMRIKIPGWILTAAQAQILATIAEDYGHGVLHLTCRGSIELHWLRKEHLKPIFEMLAAVDLTSRGACGGAVRGVSCSTALTPGFGIARQVASQIHEYFVGNPHFENLPKKFKICVETDYGEGRHLIQDVGLVLVSLPDSPPAFDIWCAGGLGREPQEAFLLEENVAEPDLLPIIAGIVSIYREHTPPGKRLKFLLNQIGEPEFRLLLQKELPRPRSPFSPGKIEVQEPLDDFYFLTIPVFAGELTVKLLRVLTEVAVDFSEGLLATTSDQNLALPVGAGLKARIVEEKLACRGVYLDQPAGKINFRVCPGSHECPMGLAPTRDLAKDLIEEILSVRPAGSAGPTWAISGCPNSCSQPQLADFGIVTRKLVTPKEGGRRTPFFDCYQREGKGLGQCISTNLCADDLLGLARQLEQRYFS